MKNYMTIQEYNEKGRRKVKNFISNILKEIFNSPAKGLEDLENIDKNFIKFWTEKDNKKIIGTIGLKRDGEKFRVARMYVGKSFRGKNIGKKLMSKLLKYCKDNKIKELFLTTYKQMNSVGFYEKMGFKVTKKDGDRIWMKCKL